MEDSEKWVLSEISLGTGLGDEDEEEAPKTPSAVEMRIPTILLCPPPPRKRKASPSPVGFWCCYGTKRDFFNPPDLESIFIRDGAAVISARSINLDGTWPRKSDGGHYKFFPFVIAPDGSSTFINPAKAHLSFFNSTPKASYSLSRSPMPDYSGIPFDVLRRIAATFTLPNLKAASLVCKTWRDALKPLREAMLFLKWGKRYKHGRGGVNANLKKALDSFLKGAARGSTLSMVDAGLIYWEMGNKEEGIAWYRRAADLGDPAGQCNLAIAYLRDNPPKTKEAIPLLYRASLGGHVRAQYQLALCLHQGRGTAQSLQEAARWYLKAAEGGYVRAMYNTSLCFLTGEGTVQCHKLARKWMKKAADHGHSKAQFEHGLSLFAEGDMMKAVVYLELATRAGEQAAGHVKNVIIQQLSVPSRERAMILADTWRASH